MLNTIQEMFECEYKPFFFCTFLKRDWLPPTTLQNEREVNTSNFFIILVVNLHISVVFALLDVSNCCNSFFGMSKAANIVRHI